MAGTLLRNPATYVQRDKAGSSCVRPDIRTFNAVTIFMPTIVEWQKQRTCCFRCLTDTRVVQQDRSSIGSIEAGERAVE